MSREQIDMWIDSIYSDLGSQLRSARSASWVAKDAAASAEALLCLLEEKVNRQ